MEDFEFPTKESLQIKVRDLTDRLKEREKQIKQKNEQIAYTIQRYNELNDQYLSICKQFEAYKAQNESAPSATEETVYKKLYYELLDRLIGKG